MFFLDYQVIYWWDKKINVSKFFGDTKPCTVVHIPKQGDCRHFLALIIFQSSHPSDQTRITFGMTKRVNETTCNFCFAKLPNKTKLEKLFVDADTIATV